MFEYQNEHYENRNQMYNYNGMPENGPAEPHKLSASPNPGHTGKKARILKKAGAITLSAILFGGVAARFLPGSQLFNRLPNTGS